MASESLAAKWRPRRFADVAGQRHVSAVLRSAAKRQDPAHQILLSGESGLGKTTLARIFAAALFCEQRTGDGDACGQCQSCQDVTGSGFHPDVTEFDAASNGGKDEIRAIADRVSFAPMRARWKVIIIDEAHGITGPGTQAFLKTLEEPPEHVVFILATTEPDKLGTALRGRCEWLEVLRPGDEEITDNLRRIAVGEGWTLDPEALEAIVAATDPALGMRGTVMTLEKLTGPLSEGVAVDADTLETVLGTISPTRLAGVTAAILSGDRPAALLGWSELARRAGASTLRRQLQAWARAMLLEACRSGVAVAEAFYRFETVTDAPYYPGAVEVAIARMCDPSLSDSVSAAQVLLEQAHEVLRGARGPAPAPAQPSVPAAATPAPAQPCVPAPATPAATAPAAVAAPVAPVTPSPETVPDVAAVPAVAAVPTAPVTAAAEAGAAAMMVAVDDTELLSLLNAVGRASGRAAAVLRRCTVTREQPGHLLIQVPEPLRAKAADSGLAAALASAAQSSSITATLLS